jgi:acetoin utilization deacetylase AcuC-like enzyme
VPCILDVDTYENDPISDLALTTDAYYAMGRLLAGLGLPTVVVQEGGYDQLELGVNVRSFVRGIGNLARASETSGE